MTERKSFRLTFRFDLDKPLAYASFLEEGERNLLAFARRLCSTQGEDFAGFREKAWAIRDRLWLKAVEATHNAVVEPAIQQIAIIEDARIRAALEKSIDG